jgi:Spy/CpxP family protein refolding chaperone
MLMRKLTMTLTAAALILGAMAVGANAQTQSSGAASVHAQIKNATPIQEAACRGFGPYCGPGFTRVCGPYRCWCRPCY